MTGPAPTGWRRRRHNRGETCPDCGFIHEHCLGHSKHSNEDRRAAARERWGTDGPWPCQNRPVHGLEVCKNHGGSAPHSKTAAAARVATQQAEQALRRRLGDTTDTQPITDPATQLARLAGELRTWYEESAALLVESTDDTFDARVALHERAQDRLAKILVDMEKIGIAERHVTIAEADAQAIVAVVARRLTESGVDPEVARLIGRDLRALEAGDL